MIGEERAEALGCVCVRKPCWQCSKEKHAGARWKDACQFLCHRDSLTHACVCVCVCENFTAESSSWSYMCSHDVVSSFLTCVKLYKCVCVCVGGKQMKTVLGSYSMRSAASPLSLYLAYNPAPGFIMHLHLRLHG